MSYVAHPSYSRNIESSPGPVIRKQLPAISGHVSYLQEHKVVHRKAFKPPDTILVKTPSPFFVMPILSGKPAETATPNDFGNTHIPPCLCFLCNN